MPILSEEDLERFRTKVCTLASSMKCDFGVERCNYSHNLYWARRCPFYLRDSSILRYIPKCCPDVELGEGTTVIRNSCPRGNNCSFAHSYEEIHYHPLVYKTEVCKDYRSGKCKTYYCHMVHGLAEYRVPREYVLPRKAGLEIPRFDHVTIVDNVKAISTGNVSTGCFQRDRTTRSIERSPTKTEGKDAAEPCNLKSWSSIKWKAKGAGAGTDREGARQTAGEQDNNARAREGAERPHNESIYDWYKLIANAKVDYTGGRRNKCAEGEASLGDIEKNYSMLKLYDKVGNTLNEYNQLGTYNNELSLYNAQFEGNYNSLNEPGRFENNINDEHEHRTEALVRRNVNVWNDSNVNKIMESSDIGGPVPTIMEDSLQSYRDVFNTSDLASSLNSLSQDDAFSGILNQCEIVRRKCRESVAGGARWKDAIAECTKLLKLVREVGEAPEVRS